MKNEKLATGAISAKTTKAGENLLCQQQRKLKRKTKSKSDVSCRTDIKRDGS